MKTIEAFEAVLPQIPTSSVWLLNDLAEYRGKQALFTRQSPQRLKRLRENALIESAVSSNRIEGVEIDRQRVGTVIFGEGHLRDRNEEEVRGYQQALAWIHGEEARIPITGETILKLHRMCRSDVGDAGQFKTRDGEIIEKHPGGRVTVRFTPLPAAETPDAVERLCTVIHQLLLAKDIPPLVLLAAFNLDFLCIHPFRDGNGRVSRLLLLLFMYHIGYEAGRYVSLERIIEQSKDRYYETLRISSQRWHQAAHDPWPHINYILFSMKKLYQEFEARYESTGLPPGEKTEAVRQAIASFGMPFHITALQKKCPEVSLDMIRKVLKDMRAAGEIECIGKGKHAQWRKLNG